jgi:hypothetical protein
MKNSIEYIVNGVLHMGFFRAVVIKYRKYSRVILQPETEVYYRQGYGGNLLLPLLICDHWN